MQANDDHHDQGQYAGFASRLIAYAIDTAIAMAGISMIWWLVSVTLKLLHVRELLEALGVWDYFSVLLDSSGNFIWRGMVYILGVGIYQVFFLALANRTIGKWIMGLQVVPLKGGRMNLVRATLRYVGYIVSTIPFFLGFFSILFSRRRQGWHDKIAGTCVIYAWEARPNEVFLRHGLRRLQEANEKRFGPPPEKVV